MKRFLTGFLSILLFFCFSNAAQATFALTKFNAYGFIIDSQIKKRAMQRATLHITAANTDTALDLGSDSGTFWTAAEADATYGDMATNALERLNEIVDNALVLNNIGGILPYQQQGVCSSNTLSYCDATVVTGSGLTEDIACSGLLTTDTLLGVTQKVKGDDGYALNAWAASAAGYITLSWTSPPGASSVSRVVYSRATGYCYTLTVTDKRPQITFVSGSAPTTYYVTLEWELSDEKYIIYADYN